MLAECKEKVRGSAGCNKGVGRLGLCCQVAMKEWEGRIYVW